MTIKHLGVITALLPEARFFSGFPTVNQVMHIGDGISLIVSGMSSSRVEAAASQMLEAGIDGLLVTGTCGALVPGLNPGDIVLPAEVATRPGEMAPADPEWHRQAEKILAGSGIPVHTGTLISADRVISDTHEKQRLHNETGAMAVDMESFAVLAAGTSRNIPVLVLRTVIDPVEFTIPAFILKSCDPYGDTSITSLLKSCLNNPRNLVRLIRIAMYNRRAGKTLRIIRNKLEKLAGCIPDITQVSHAE